MIINIYANKSRVLKTTIATNLAFIIKENEKDKKISIIELDTQDNVKSALSNKDIENIDLVKYSENLLNKMVKIKETYNYIIIDNPTSINNEVKTMLEVSYLIIHPIQLETFWIKEFLNFINNFNYKITNKLKFIIPVLFNSRTSIHRDNLSVLEELCTKNNLKKHTKPIKNIIRVVSTLFNEDKMIIEKIKIFENSLNKEVK